MKVHFASATRRSPTEFQSETALGRSLVRIAHDVRLDVRVAAANLRGLPLVYNEILDQIPPENIIVFLHDDVWIDDYFLIQRLIEGLEQFDVLGLAGNRRRLPRQPAWHYSNLQFEWDHPQYLSGSIAQGPDASGAVSHYGGSPAECELLDGVFLAARARTLQERGVRFDARFDFHFYDLDFCRTARQQGLRLGTWPICVTHQGESVFGSPEWRRNYQTYLEKWGE